MRRLAAELRGFARGFRSGFSRGVADGRGRYRESFDRAAGHMRRDLIHRPFAHRGLHTMPVAAGRVGPWSAGHRPENAMSAFHAAEEAGYGIECDLQLTRDGRTVVFHDRTLDRMTNGTGRVVDHDLDTIAALTLRGADEGVPTLADLLAAVDGRVPLLLELKGEDADPDAFVAAVARDLDGYAGFAALMSFLSPLTDRFRTALPGRARGLTAQGDDRAHDAHRAAFERGDLHFVSYDVNDLPCRFTRELRERGVPVLCWTVRTPDDVARCDAHADQMTFEGFLPSATAFRSELP